MQYLLDQAGTVTEALGLLDGIEILMVSAHGHDATLHLAMEDATGDSAIVEYVEGKRVVHHGRQFTLMTNDPTYDEQLALLAKQDFSHPSREMPLPGNVNPVDRFQRAAYYAEDGARRHLLSYVEQLSGRDLSFNNLNDLNAARMLVREFSIPACVIVKHANPCGVAAAATIEEAYEKALMADPLSAYGGVIALNRPVSLELGMMLSGQFVEVVIAPGYDETGLELLKQKPSVRTLDDRERRRVSAGERDYKRVLGGLLVQDRDVEVQDRDEMNVVTGKPDERLWGDMLFAWRVCKHVTSNAIVLAKDMQTIGIGAGQMSRVDSVRIAVAKAREHGHDLRGAVLASDAFFPFDDGPKIALEAGVAAVIQPGGSKRDSEVIATVRMHNAAMVFTHRRHFRH